MNNIPANSFFSTTLFNGFSLFKISILIPIVTIFILTSCNNATKQPDRNDEPIIKIRTMNCYTFTSEKDSVFMEINVEGNLVNGNLVYTLFQKDQTLIILTSPMLTGKDIRPRNFPMGWENLAILG